MTTQITLGLLIVVLLGYIIYLHLRLSRKNLFIESTVKRLSGIEKSWSVEEMMLFLREIKKVSHYSSFFTENLFEEKPIGFLLENQKDSRVYIHYTKEEIVAENIIKEGFRFADSFYKTALPVSNDRLDLLIKHNGRKSFEHYASELDRKGLKDYSVENILTEKAPFRNENADLVYELPNKFVKGYINHHTGEIKANPEFNPFYDSRLFERNIDQINGKNKN
jgi:hypothetical protein